MEPYPAAHGAFLELPAAPLDPLAEQHMVSMHDGVELATDVYIPEPSSVAYPAVLIRHPYDKSGRPAYTPHLAHYLAAHGFATVVQDVRGKFRSNGSGQEMFIHEAEDGAATLDWIAVQPWSSGSIGMYGDSYYGFTQWAAASTRHPALKAISPGMAGHHWHESLGLDVPNQERLDWAMVTFSQQNIFFRSPLRQMEPLSGGLASVPEPFRAFRKTLEDFIELAKSRDLSRIFPGGESPAASVSIPALHRGGWYDPLQDWQIQSWLEAADKAPASQHQFLRMDATDHIHALYRDDFEPQGSHEETDSILRERMPRLMDEAIRFFDHYLRGRGGRWPAARVVVNTVFVGYEAFDRWPPRGAIEKTFCLGSGDKALASEDGGLLGTVPDTLEAEVRWIHDPTTPVPSLIPAESASLHFGLPDESRLHARPDVLTFTSERFEEPLDLLGPVSAELTVGSEAPSMHVVARLLDVFPDGSARLIRRGVARVATPDGGVQVASVSLGDIAYRVQPGHRLRVAISSSWYPMHPVHPGTDEDPLYATDGRSVQQTLRLGGPSAASLELTVRGVGP